MKVNNQVKNSGAGSPLCFWTLTDEQLAIDPGYEFPDCADELMAEDG